MGNSCEINHIFGVRFNEATRCVAYGLADFLARIVAEAQVKIDR
jgi:hypothetical protein